MFILDALLLFRSDDDDNSGKITEENYQQICSFLFCFMESYRWGRLGRSSGSSSSSLSSIQHLDIGSIHYLHINQSNSSSFCFPTNSIHTKGLWLGDNPLNYPLDLLLFQLSIISIVSCALYALLKPLGHPAIVHQILVREICNSCMESLCLLW